MRILAVTLFAVLAFASPALASSVTNVSVDNSAPSSAAGARTSYVVGFKATNGVAAAAKITVTFPVGATFSGWVGGTVNVGATAIGTCGAPSNGVVDCTLFTGQTIANGTDVVVTLNGVTNPGNGANTLNVRTTADADPVNAQFALTAAGTLTQVTVNNASPSTAAGARTRYLTSFKLSATGGLSAQANSRVTVLFPPNTSFLGWAGGVLTVDGTDVGTCSGPSTNTVQCSLFTGRTIASGATVQLALNGVTNTTDVGQRTISVDTTSDPASTPSAPFTVAAAGAVTGVTVDNTVPSAAAGARTQYVVRFTTSATGGLSAAANSRISIPFQSGTGFTGWAGGVISAGGDDVGNCAGPNGLLVECSLFTGDAIAPNTQVTITFSGVTNPGTPGTATKLSVGTTSDPGLVFSANFTVLSAGTLSAVTVANGAPTAASGARTRFVVGFTLSATGGLSAAANSRLDFTFPTGTTFGGWAGGTISVGGTAVGNCSAPNGLAVQCALFTDRSIAAGAAVTVTFAGVTNPAAAGADKAMTVATTSDPAVTASAPFTVVPAGAVSGVTAANDVPSRGAGARTRYVVGFIASATGALSAEANSRLTFTFPAGTTFGGWAGATMRDVTRGADVGICSAPSGLNVECALFTSQFVNAGDSVRVTFEGVANPTVPSAGNTVSVSTTSDPQTIASAPFSVVAGGALTDVGVTVASLTPSARTRYVVRLRASATGGLSEAANSRLDVTFPAGTTFTGWSGGSVLDVSRGVTVGICSAPNGLAVQCALFTDAFTAAGDELRITFGDVTNPAAAGPQQLSVSTTSDTPVVTSASYREGDTVAPDTTIDSGPTGGPPDPTRSFTFSASEPGGTFECRVDAGPFTACASPHTTPPQANGTYTFQVRAVDAGGNPDPTPAGRAFTITGVAPETTVRSGPSGTTENASPVFTFDSPDANATFECALDGAFTPCASPKAYSGLGEGEHLFRVRAVDAAGLPDPTPATRAFTVRTTPAVTPTPTPTATATPAATSTSVPTATATATPTPTPAPTAPPVQNRSVTAEPVSGSVLVNVGGKFVPLNAQVVTNGTEIDVRKGKIELTTAAGEKAVFYDGIFKVSQSGGITTLTLTEKLDCPTSKGRARASAKKPKSRKLWGDGKGKFRTKGSYSAATIRGTRWLVQDTCTSTLTRVAEGVVSVQDFGRKRTITLRAGKRYTATRR